jgi:hypothetical protein
MRQSGDRSHFWKGGALSESMRIRGHKSYDAWRRKVFERDGFECQACFKVGGKLTAHHIVRFSKEPKLRLKVSNGVTLCKDCHGDYHRSEAVIGQKESALQAKVMKFLLSEPGCHALNVHGSAFQTKGTPDIVAVVAGRAVFFELKVMPNFVSPIQKHSMRQWSESGAICRVAWSLDEVISIVDAIKIVEGIPDE